MTILLDAVTSIFSQHGAARKILSQYRPMQHEFAVGLAKFCDNRTHDAKVPVYVHEIMTGIGKTHVVGVVLGLDAIINQRRGVLATYTRGLRREYLAHTDIINEMLKQGLCDIGQPMLYRPVTIGEYKSITAYISPAKILTLKARLANGQIEVTPQLLNLIRFFDEQMEHGHPAEFSDFFVSGGSVDGGNGELPPYTSEMDLALCQADKNSFVMKQLQADNNAAKTADIMVTTHAMLVRNSIARGKILNTDRDIEDDDDDRPSKRNGIVMIDEGDKLPNIAYANVSTTVSRNVLTEFQTDVEARYKDAKTDTVSEITDALASIHKGVALIDQWSELRLPNRPSVNVRKDEQLMTTFPSFLEHVHSGIKTIRRVAHGDYHIEDRDVIILDQCERLIQDVWFVIRKAFYANHPMLSIDYSKDTYGTPDIRLTLNLGFGRHLINQLWRPGNHDEPVHTFAGVVMISATLTDLPPHRSQYLQFLRTIGYDSKIDGDRLVEVDPIRAHPKSRPWGRVQNLAIIHRDVALHPTDMTQPNNINRAFLDQAVIAIKAAMDRQLTRPPSAKMLILCPSYAMVDLLAEQLIDGDRIIKRQPSADLRAAMEQFIKIGHAVWIGVEWEGANFVDRAGKSLISTLVIARMPVPPPDHLKMERSAGGHELSGNDPAQAGRIAANVAMRESVLIAYRRVIQGLGRAFRNANDVLEECLLLDQRFPAPRNVAARRKIARSSTVDVTNLFMHFDTIIECHAVKHWCKIERNGSLTSLA